MAEITRAVPKLGDFVHYFDPRILSRIGWTQGYADRNAGPYIALVTNENCTGGRVDLTVFLPGVPPFIINKVAGPETDKTADEVYWGWKDPAQKARATSSSAR